MEFALHVERFYASLISAAETPEPSLGGKLLYAGELDAEARVLVVAANIAGAATLTASADAPARKQALRDGVVDFLVTSLDEALRILKNELRKGETVAVCVAAAPELVEAEMRERGVQPDLAARGWHDLPHFPASMGRCATQVTLSPVADCLVRLNWRVAADSTRWLPRLDTLALGCLPASEWASRRWLRLAPRYLGRMAQGARVLTCAPEIAKEFMARIQLAVERSEINVQVFVSLSRNGETFLLQPKPPTGPDASTED
jgi:urocanate hydratase